MPVSTWPAVPRRILRRSRTWRRPSSTKWRAALDGRRSNAGRLGMSAGEIAVYATAIRADP